MVSTTSVRASRRASPMVRRFPGPTTSSFGPCSGGGSGVFAVVVVGPVRALGAVLFRAAQVAGPTLVAETRKGAIRAPAPAAVRSVRASGKERVSLVGRRPGRRVRGGNLGVGNTRPPGGI